MQIVSDRFTTLAQSSVRPLSWMVLASFPKNFSDLIDFFEIGTSLIGGNDVIKPFDSSVIQEWDKYEYTDYSSRVISLEWSKEVKIYNSVTMGIADVVFDNRDDYFTPSGGSEIADYILPYRPIRIYAGFGGEVTPVFIGLTDGMPVIDEKRKTASFHCIDFMYSLMDTPLNQSAMYVDYTVDQLISALFVLAGLSSSQLTLETSEITIPFAYFKKDMKLGDAIKKVVSTSLGRLYMDEFGVIHFYNNDSYEEDIKYTFTAYNNILESKTVKRDDIVNVVEIKGKVREVQPLQKYWNSTFAITVPPLSSVDVWADFQDPVTSVSTPLYKTSSVTSFFEVNTAEDGSGSADSSNVTLTSSTLFGTSYKMVFANASVEPLYITQISLFATPAIITKGVYVREEDEESVETYDERIVTIDNDFFQDADVAQSQALILIRDNADYGQVDELIVQGTPALQVGDQVRVNLFDRIDSYKILKTSNKLSLPAKYTQILKLKKFTPTVYFTIGVSLIEGTDEIHP